MLCKQSRSLLSVEPLSGGERSTFGEGGGDSGAVLGRAVWWGVPAHHSDSLKMLRC